MKNIAIKLTLAMTCVMCLTPTTSNAGGYMGGTFIPTHIKNNPLTANSTTLDSSGNVVVTSKDITENEEHTTMKGVSVVVGNAEYDRAYETEIGYVSLRNMTTADDKNLKLRLSHVGLNSYVFMQQENTPVLPYVSVGVGVARMTLNAFDYKGNVNAPTITNAHDSERVNFIVNGGVGLWFPVSSKFTTQLGYRLTTAIPTPKFYKKGDEDITYPLFMHSLAISFRMVSPD